MHFNNESLWGVSNAPHPIIPQPAFCKDATDMQPRYMTILNILHSNAVKPLLAHMHYALTAVSEAFVVSLHGLLSNPRCSDRIPSSRLGSLYVRGICLVICRVYFVTPRRSDDGSCQPT